MSKPQPRGSLISKGDRGSRRVNWYGQFLQRLTSRERQIADLVAKGLTNTEIGQELWITQNSVKQALKRMFRKLEVTARTELVAKLRD
jgi:DNA-binding NarL/FixJ family response regulator